MLPGDSETRRRIGIAATVVGLVVLGAFVFFGDRLFDGSVLVWAVFGVAVALTAVGIALIRIADRG
jgi:hypothetical protein